MGRFANDAKGLARIPGLKNNSEYMVEGNKCFIDATRNIQKGEEIFVEYGKEFWDLIKKIEKEKSTKSSKK